MKVGSAVMTPGFALKARFILHTAGPVYVDGRHGEEKLLASCYENCVDLAREKGLKSLVFPLISSGIFGYPKREAIAVALKTLLKKDGKDMALTLILYTDEDFALAKKALREEDLASVLIDD